MAIEEAGPDPVDLAMAVHAGLDHGFGPVPVEAIAAALEIVEIRMEKLKGLAGALVMPPDRNFGSILVDAIASKPRRRFTIAHELGHFLSLHHRPMQLDGGFVCTNNDLAAFEGGYGRHGERHWRQETEANRFAITLLAPAPMVRPFVAGPHHLQYILDMAETLGLSKEAAARRYVECNPAPVALIFAQHGKVRYYIRQKIFPFMSLRKGQHLPETSPPANGSAISIAKEVKPLSFGLVAPLYNCLFVQTLHQMNDFSITLLTFDSGVFDKPTPVDDGCPI